MPDVEVAVDDEQGAGAAGRESPAKTCHFDVAMCLDDVLEAWALVYKTYCRQGYIDPNSYGLHTVPQAVTRGSTVMTARGVGEVVSTVTLMSDGPLGLPLDSVYAEELDRLRRGRRLAEVGLLADEGRAFERVFGLMRLVFWRAIHGRVTDLVVGVHPHHVGYYSRFFGFEVCGALREYPTVNNRPVVALRADIAKVLSMPRLPRGAARCIDEAVPAHAFQGRYAFTPDEVATSPIGQLLAERAVEEETLRFERAVA